jgi:PAS domain S-box-containing protein
MQEPNDANRAVSQLQAELGRLRARVAELEASQAKVQQVEEAQRRRAQELDALQTTVLDITIPHDLPSLLQTIVERAARLLDAPSGGLYLCDAEQQQVHCVVSYNTPQDYRGTVLEYGEGAAGTVALTAEPLIIDDYGTWEGRALAFEQHQPFRAVLAVPMIWRGTITGVIDIVRYEEDAIFTEEDLALLSLFANHAAIAVENTRLYEQAQDEIAKRMQLEQQSEERRVYLESMLACTPDAIVTLNARHRVLEWNPGAERLFGYTLEEAAGRDLDALIAAPDAAMFEQAIGFTRQSLRGEPVSPTETVRYRKDGSPIDVIVAGSPIFVQDELVGTVAVYTDITAYKKAQEALRRRVEELDALQATVLDITIPHDLPTVLETIVERAARMLDAPGGGLYLCEPDREQTRYVVSLNAPRDFRGTVFRYGEGIVGTVAQSGKPIKIEGQHAVTEHAPVPGETPPFGAVLAVPLIWQGTVTGVIVIVHTLEGQAFSDADLELLTLFANHAAIAVENARLYDLAQEEIAERKRTLRELNSSRQLLQTIYDAIPDAVVSTDPSFRIVSCNAAVERILGYRADELIGQSYATIMPRELFLDPRQGGRPAELFEKGYLADEEDYCFKRKNGQAFPGSFSVALIKDDQGRPMGAVGTIRDITERRQAEEEIEQLKEFNEGIVQNMAEGIAVQDAEGCFRFINPAGIDMLGYAPEDLIGKHWTSIVPPDQQSIVQAADERRMRGESDRYEVELVRRDGARLPVLTSGSPRFHTETGQFVGTLAVFTDISERVQAEQALARRAREMAALYRTSLEINAQLDLSTLLKAIVQRAAELVGARMGGLYMIEPDGQELELVVGYNMPAEYIGARLDLGEGLSGRVCQSGEPMMVADYQAWEGQAGVYKDYPFRRVLGVPLKIGDRVIGAINVTDDEQTGPFDEDQVRLVSLFADQAAIAVENTRLFQETEQRLKELTLLFEISTAISTSLDEDKVLHTAAEQIIGVLEVEGCSITLWDRAHDLLVNKLDYSPNLEWWKPAGPGTVYRLDDYPATRRLLHNHQPLTVHVSDADADPADIAWMREEGVQSLLMVPMIARDEAIGILEVHEIHGERDFTPTEISLCQTLANQAAAALENARLYRETQQRLTELTMLFETSTAISTSLDVDEVLQATTRQIATALAAEGCAISRWDRHQDVLTTRLDYASDFNLWSPEPPGTTYHLDDYPATRQVLESRRPCTVRLSNPDADPAEVALMRQLGIQSLLMVPLVVRDQAIGLLEIQETRQEREFTFTEISLCQTLANLAAAALENARLFEAEREHRELAEALRRAAAAVSSTLDLDQVLDLILEQVSRVITYDAANVMLIEGDQARVVRSRGYERFDVSDSIQSVTLHIPDTPGLRHVLETGEPLVIPNTAAYPGWIDLPETRWLRSIVISPIRVQDRVIGFLNVDSATSDFFHAGQTDRLRAFADQASMALTNAQLFQTVEQGKRDWETTFDAMQDAIVLVDRADHVVRANRAFANLAGRAPMQIAGQAYHSLLDGAVCPETTCPLEQTMQGGGPAICVHEYQEQVLEVQTTPIFTNGSEQPGFASRVIYVLRDITGRREAEREIRRRNRDLALLNRVIAASATSPGSELALQTACRELALAFDVSHAIAIFYSQEEGEPAIAAEHRCSARGSVLGMTIPLVGTPIHQELQESQSPLVLDDARNDPRTAHLRDLIIQQGVASLLILPLSVEGEVLGAIVLPSTEPRSFSDDEVGLAWRVAEQVSGALARARLQESQQRLSAAVEQAAEAVVITDTDGFIFYANPAFEQLTGYDHTEFCRHSPRLFSGTNQEQIDHGEMWQVVTAGRPWQGRFAGNSKDGRPFKADLVVTPVRNQTGDIVNFVGTMRDVTREVQLEEQFQQAQRMEALGRLAGGIAHDFNNLLTVIHLSTRLMERQLRPEDPLWDHVQRIQETGERATKLTRQLLSFSRREFAEPQVLDLNQVVSDLSRMLKRIIGEDIDLVTDLADDLWLIKVDPSQIDQVLMNLVLNARDAMPDGGTLTIRTANVRLDEAYAAAHVDARAGRHVLLTISDTGMGIDGEAKAHLFEPFFTTKEFGQGTGLGLSTVFGIITQNGGHIRVESEPEQGATFQILLPSMEGQGAQVVSSAHPPPSPQPTNGTETILVAEDEEHVRNLAVSVLRSCGYHVLPAKDGPEAIQISEQYSQPIHLLITDVVMPQLGGRELAERLQRQRPALRVMYISGYVDEEISQYSASTPGMSFMSKPFTIEDLTQKVRTMLDGKE